MDIDLSVFQRGADIANTPEQRAQLQWQVNQQNLANQLKQQQFAEQQRQFNQNLAMEQQKLNLYKQGLMGNSVPAALQLTNAYLQARQAGDTERANALMQFAKTQEAQAQFAQPIAQQKAYGTALGKAQGEAQMDLPRVQQNAELALKAINDVRNAPGLSSVVGLKNPLQGAIPFTNMAVSGTPAADAQAAIDQLKGKTFLEAYASLKGGGQITEVEGKKATDAIARLNTAQSELAFKKALDDLEDVINKGANRAKAKAGGLYTQSKADFESSKPADVVDYSEYFK